jgi:hypothetical protein
MGASLNPIANNINQIKMQVNPEQTSTENQKIKAPCLKPIDLTKFSGAHHEWTT